MAFISIVSEQKATGEVAELYQADRARLGYVANYTKVFAHRSDVYRVWMHLNGAIKEGMGLRRYELATLAAARRLRSSYCALAHGSVLRDRFFDAETVRELATDRRSAGLDPMEAAVMDLAEQVVDDATAITEEHLDVLRERGLSDIEILDVILAAAARCFFSKVLDATGSLPDPVYRNLEPELREVLTVGRPIEEG